LKNYEGLFILKPELAKEELSQLHQVIHENIKKYNGEIETAEDWGKKSLAYEINKQKEGIYYLLKFKIDPKQVKALNTDLKLNESVVRVMLTVSQ